MTNKKSWNDKCTNLALAILKTSGYFYELPYLTIDFFSTTENEELSFWLISGLLADKLVAPFLKMKPEYGYELHLFIIANITKHRFSELQLMSFNDI